WLGYQWYWDRAFRTAIAEADRLDPGWRLMELEAARAEIPDSENAAIQVLAVRKLLPPGWFAPPPASPSTPMEDDLDHLPPTRGAPSGMKAPPLLSWFVYGTSSSPCAAWSAPWPKEPHRKQRSWKLNDCWRMNRSSRCCLSPFAPNEPESINFWNSSSAVAII